MLVLSQSFVILDTVELSLYDDADTRLGAFALKNLKVHSNSSSAINGIISILCCLFPRQAVRMLEGQSEGSMVGFKLDFRQATALTLRVRVH